MTFVTRVFNVNVFSAMEIIRPLAQRRVNKGALRSITFISSISSRMGAKGYSVYAASKGALNAMALSLAVELAPAVRVNSVLPGTIETEMNKEHFRQSRFCGVRAEPPIRWVLAVPKTWRMPWSSVIRPRPLDHRTGDCRGWRQIRHQVNRQFPV